MTNIEIMANLAREDQLFVYSPFNGGRMELLTIAECCYRFDCGTRAVRSPMFAVYSGNL